MIRGLTILACFPVFLCLFGCFEDQKLGAEPLRELVSTNPTPQNKSQEVVGLMGVWTQTKIECDDKGNQGMKSDDSVKWEFLDAEVIWNNFTLNYTVSDNNIFISGEGYRYKILNKKTLLLKRDLDKGYFKLEKKE